MSKVLVTGGGFKHKASLSHKYKNFFIIFVFINLKKYIMALTRGMTKAARRVARGLNPRPGRIGTATGSTTGSTLGNLVRDVIRVGPFKKGGKLKKKTMYKHGGKFWPQHD